MCDPRHPPDTLFIVLEEDFRLYNDERTTSSTAEDSDESPNPSADLETYHAYTESADNETFMLHQCSSDSLVWHLYL